MQSKSINENFRVFENSFLESLTHVHPVLPLLLWSPVVIFCFYLSLVREQNSLYLFGPFLLVGLLVWTLTEYLLHRFVFHYPAKGRVGKYLVFLFHGLHHDVPGDATRLVMPPAPAVILMAMLYFIFWLVIPKDYLHGFMGFFIIGYLAYDYIHYATHHFPMKSPIGRFLRSWHLRHHHSGEKSRFGVSSPLWDYVFGTY